MPIQQWHIKAHSIQHNECMPANEINISMNRASNTMSACLLTKPTSARPLQLFDRSQGGCCLRAGQSVMSAAPVGGTMAAGALLVIDSASQPHCLWPNRAPAAPEVSTALREHHTDTVLLASRCKTTQKSRNHMLCLFSSSEHMPTATVNHRFKHCRDLKCA